MATLFALLAFAFAPSVRAVQSKPGAVTLPTVAATPAPWPWEGEIRAFETSDKLNPPPQGAILFVGASGIGLWKSLQQDFPDYVVINRVFGGSHMSDSVHFADRIVSPYRPKLIVIQAGGNDLAGGKSPQRVLADFQAFVEKVRAALPKARIAFLSVNPSPARWALAAKQRETNQLVKNYITKESGLDYINFWDALVGPDGKPRPDLFVGDRLHNNATGYKVRAQVVRTHLGPPNRPGKTNIATHADKTPRP